MSTADAVAREVAFLVASGDGLPALLKADDGPWDIVQAYWPRTPANRQTGIYVMRPSIDEVRFNNQRKLDSYLFRLKLVWPLGATTGTTAMWEGEQAALDGAVDLLLGRIRGHLMDHTHGSFMAVAETPGPGRIAVHFEDPERSATSGALRAEVTYAADDIDITA